MALPSSGPISMSQINTELSVPATTLISLNQTSARTLANVPSGMISLSNFYGKSNVVNVGVIMTGIASTQTNNVFNFSTETVSFNTPTGVNSVNGYSAAINSVTSGYGIGGGQPQIPTQPTNGLRQTKIEFSTLTQSALAAMDTILTGVGGEYSTPTNGFYSTGRNRTLYPLIVRKFPYPTQTFTTLSVTAPTNRFETGSAQNAFVCGYTYNGRADNQTTFPTNGEKFVFSSETMGIAPNVLPNTRSTGAAFQSSSTGYWLGGSYVTPHATRNQTVTTITFSTEACGQLGVTTDLGRGMSVLNGTNNGYVIGSEPTPTAYMSPSIYGRFNKITFSNNAFTIMGVTMLPATPMWPGIRTAGTQPNGVSP